MAAGPRSLLAFWIGGAGAITPSASQAGVRGLLAPWIGGAGATTGGLPATVGYAGLLGFWIGGAAAGIAPAPTPSTGPIGGPPRRIRLPSQLIDAQRSHLMTADDLLLVLAAQIAAGLIH